MTNHPKLEIVSWCAALISAICAVIIVFPQITRDIESNTEKTDAKRYELEEESPTVKSIGHTNEVSFIGANKSLDYIFSIEMNKYDRQQLNHVYERGVSGTTSSWVNPNNGNKYKVTPRPAYSSTSAHKQVCRWAEINIIHNSSNNDNIYSIACRDKDGTWKVQNNTMLGYIHSFKMNKYDRQQLNRVFERGVSGKTLAWINPDTGNQYEVTTKPSVRNGINQICKKAEINITLGGKRTSIYSTACQDKQGQWVVQ